MIDIGNSGISFDDGQVTIERLQKMVADDESMYNEILSKPYGVLNYIERTTDFQGANSQTYGVYETVLDGLTVTPVRENAIVKVGYFIPLLWSNSINFLRPLYAIYRGEGQISTMVPSPLALNGVRYAASICGYTLDVLPNANVEYTYSLAQYGPASSATYYRIQNTATNPTQIWVEDTGLTGEPTDTRIVPSEKPFDWTFLIELQKFFDSLR